MRLSTQSLQKKLNSKSKGKSGHGKASPIKLPIGLLLLIAWLAGAMFSFSLAPYGYWVLALVSPAILYALLLSPMSNKRAFLIGEAYGMGLWCVGAFWLYTAIHTYGETPAVFALLAIVMMGLFMGLFHGVMAWFFHAHLGKQPFAFAAIWVAQEWLKTWVFTGFPWLFVGYAFTEQYWLSSIAPVFGVFAVSFLAVLFAASAVEVARRRAGFFIAAILFVLSTTALWQINPQWTQAKDTPNLKVSLIQGNIPQDIKWLTEYQYETLEIYAKLTSTEWDSDVIIWPESAIPMFQTQAMAFINKIDQIAQETDTAWITGIPFKDDEKYNPQVDFYPPFYNSVLALGKGGEGLYKKQRLVPFGEYIPFEGVLNLFPNLAGSQDIMSYRRGNAQQAPLKVRGHNVGSALCYEVAYPETTRKNAMNTDFLLTISNDAWFGSSAGPLQHLQMVQMRSLETGRWFVRGTNTGVTAIINERGKIVDQAPQFKRTVLRGEVQARTGQTPFMRYGQYPILGFISVLLLLSFLGKRSVKKSLYGR